MDKNIIDKLIKYGLITNIGIDADKYENVDELINKGIITIPGAKQKILELKGKEVKLHINRGRRKISNYRARIENVYASVFTVKSCSLDDVVNTYSYNDILCGEVKILND
jgi:uncharacterized protein Veg